MGRAPEFDKETRARAREALEIAAKKYTVPYKQLRGDIELAQRLLDDSLSSNTKPTEKEARAAARKVLEAIAEEYRARDRTNQTIPTMTVFLVSLAKAIDPSSVPKTERDMHTRKVYFRDISTGAKRTRTAFRKHLDIAREVLLLNKQGKPGTHLVAEKYGMADSAISRICARPAVKEAATLWLSLEKIFVAALKLERAAKEESSDT